MKKSINYIIVILIILIFAILSILIIKNKNEQNNANKDIKTLMLEFVNNKNYKVTSTSENDSKKVVKEFYRKDEKVKIDTISEEDPTIDEFMQYDPDLVDKLKKEQDDRINTNTYYDDNYKYELCSTTNEGKSWINFNNDTYIVYFEDVIEDLKNENTIVEEQENENIQNIQCKKIKITTDKNEYYVWVDITSGAVMKKEIQNMSEDESTVETVIYSIEYNVVTDENVTLPNIEGYTITDKV